ncbi:lipocalin family protein [Formosa sp. PL04]|uniref:lipocalin family protein n=1 Tax=Formosa sp. PL04 TaxID=3081755 RepID=UPI002981B147|nr:lipocalin family protein [Formosa sp. PL04]MDW5287572.1 lipocalin family protein [Formosa sp. PL04]
MKHSKYIKHTIILIIMAIIFSSCATIPEKVEAVSPFNKEKYLGKWYEIARLDFKYEKDLNNTTANYTINPNNSIKVVNKGYNYVKKEWTEADGKAKFIDSDTIAKLKVSFFGPFYAGYNVIALAEDYKYALVAGKNLDYLWILSRETTIPEHIKQDFLNTAETIGYNTKNLIWVKHDKS